METLKGTVLVWDTNTGQTLSLLKGHTDSVWGVAMSLDGRLVASASADATVRLWAASSGYLLKTLSGHIGPVRAVALSADGHLLASGGWDGTVQLWDTTSGEQIRILQPERRYTRLDITGLKGITALPTPSVPRCWRWGRRPAGRTACVEMTLTTLVQLTYFCMSFALVIVPWFAT